MSALDGGFLRLRVRSAVRSSRSASMDWGSGRVSLFGALVSCWK